MTKKRAMKYVATGAMFGPAALVAIARDRKRDQTERDAALAELFRQGYGEKEVLEIVLATGGLGFGPAKLGRAQERVAKAKVAALEPAPIAVRKTTSTGTMIVAFVVVGFMIAFFGFAILRALP